MSQNILENKSSTDAVRALEAVGLTERIVDSDHRGILVLGEWHLDRATGMEASVDVHALVIQDAFEDAALEDIASANQQPFSPAVFDTEDVLVLGKGVGDEVTCSSQAMGLSEVEVISCGDAQLGRKLKLVSALDHSPLQRAVGVEVSLERETVA